MATPVKFSHETRVELRRITGEPGENRGVARDEADLVYIVRASLGAVVLRVRVQLSMAGIEHDYGPAGPLTVSSHFKRKINDWWVDSEKCDVLEQGHCFGDTAYGLARDAWEAFLKSYEDGWTFLEQVYLDWRKKS